MSHAIALAAGFLLDLAAGDPLWLPHPVVAIGRLIARLEKWLRRLFSATPRGELFGGAVLVAVVASLSFGVAYGAVAIVSHANHWAGAALESFLCYQTLATKCLRDAGMTVFDELARGDLPAARRAVGRIVGRDTDSLDNGGVARATVETVAENSSDGVVAPLLYFAVGGAPLAVLYKAINTMDSMLGYKNDKYLYFGRAAARLDDVANFVPARLTALLMIPAAALAGLDWRGAARTVRRDRLNHTSPNSGHPEAACAGALGVRLGGGSHYGGRLVAKPAIGDDGRAIEAEDIRRAGRLLYWTAVLCFVLCAGCVVITRFLIDGAIAWN